jgi:hypothetical protein
MPAQHTARKSSKNDTAPIFDLRRDTHAADMWYRDIEKRRGGSLTVD